MHRLSPLIGILLFTSSASAIVRRDDVSDTLYTALGTTLANVVWIQSPSAITGKVTLSSGTLIAPDWILTCAHALKEDGHDYSLPASWSQISVGDGSNFGANYLSNGVKSVILLGAWDGNAEDANDLALIQLNSADAIAPMNRYNGTASSLRTKQVTFAGYGNKGDGIHGEDKDDMLHEKRGGQNVIDRLGSAIGNSDDLVLTDFDSLLVNPAFSPSDPFYHPDDFFSVRLGDTWVPRQLEAAMGHGDSGGPWIVNGEIAAVHSGSPFGNNTYGTVERATAIGKHNDWINSAMVGVNWNSRAAATFDTSAAWGDGRVPASGADVRFSLPLNTGSTPTISFTLDTLVDNLHVEFGPHIFSPRGNVVTGGRITVDAGGTMTILASEAGQLGQLKATNRLIVGDTRGPYAADGIFEMNANTLVDVSDDTTTSLLIGNNGKGVFNQSGGTLKVASRTYLGNILNSQGTYNMSGGSATFSDSVYVGNNGTGKLYLTGGTLTAMTDITVGAGNYSTFIFKGGTLHVRYFNGPLTNDGGTLAPGTAVGKTLCSINGDYTQTNDGTLEMEIFSPISYDVLAVSGATSLHGILKIELVGFTPIVNSQFHIFNLNWGSVSGGFAPFDLRIGAGLMWNMSQLYTTGMISVVAAVPGDFNYDGIVDGADYVVWRKTDGSSSNYNLWRANFGRSLGIGASAMASTQTIVPEPASLMLLFAVSLVASTMRRRSVCGR